MALSEYFLGTTTTKPPQKYSALDESVLLIQE
jgi:hypothetical protein